MYMFSLLHVLCCIFDDKNITLRRETKTKIIMYNNKYKKTLWYEIVYNEAKDKDEQLEAPPEGRGGAPEGQQVV